MAKILPLFREQGTGKSFRFFIYFLIGRNLCADCYILLIVAIEIYLSGCISMREESQKFIAFREQVWRYGGMEEKVFWQI